MNLDDERGPASGERAPTRGQRRRARTRAQLIEAAGALFARQGVDATRINEITEEADVGFGSFYNHFSSKDELVAAVLEQSVTAHAEAIDRLTDPLDDPAEVVSVAHRHFVRLATDEPEIAWLLIRLDASHRVMDRTLAEPAMRHLRQGMDAGRFRVSDPHVTLAATGGALLAVMRAVLDGRVGERADVSHAEVVLRMLGLGVAQASRVAAREMPGG